MKISSKLFIFILIMYHFFQYKVHKIKQLELLIKNQKKQVRSKYFCKYELSKFVNRNLKKLLRSDFCFIRSYICVMLLKRYGYSPYLYIGACNNEDEISSHAWVKEGNDILFESKESIKNYSVLTVFR